MHACIHDSPAIFCLSCGMYDIRGDYLLEESWESGLRTSASSPHSNKPCLVSGPLVSGAYPEAGIDWSVLF